MSLSRTALASLMLGTAACEGPDFGEAKDVSAMICADTLQGHTEDPESSDAPLSDLIALTRDGLYSSESKTSEGDLCVVQPYFPADPNTTEPLDSETLQDLVSHRVVGMAYPTSVSFAEAYEAETLGTIEVSTNCADLGNESGAPLCLLFCPEWQEPSTFLVTDTCESVVPVDGKTTEDEVPVVSEY